MRAQELMEKRISVNYKNASLPYILSNLKERYYISFSYASSLYTPTTKVTFKAESAPLKEVLKKILGNNIQYEQKGTTIILRKKNIKLYTTTLSAPKQEFKDSVLSVKPKKILSDTAMLPKVTITVVNSFIANDLPPKILPAKTSVLVSTNRITTAKHYVKDSKYQGIVNVSAECYHRTQVGFFNIARNVNGSQFGLINIAKSVSGQQIGILNFNKSGYRKIELYSSSAFTGNILYKTGSRYFHSIFALGVKPKGDSKALDLGIGYGLGSEIEISKKKAIAIDMLLYQQQQPNHELFNKLNLMGQLRINWSYALTPALSVFMGPQLCLKNSQHTTDGDNDGDRDDEKRKADCKHSTDELRLQPGINGGIRF